MAEIKLFLLSSIFENEYNINQFFPLENHDQDTSSELLKIKKYFKNCGDGCLQTKDFKYYYKTFVPFVKNYQNFFLLFYCTNSYSEKNIDKLCEELFYILDDEPIEETELKSSAKSEINKLFLQYQHLSNDNNYNNININLIETNHKISKKNVFDFSDDRSDINSLKNYFINNKRGDPRFFAYYMNKQSRNESDLFSDSNAFKTCSFDDDSGVNTGRRFNDITNENMEKWRKIKKNFLIFSVILGIITYFLLPLLLKLLFN